MMKRCFIAATGLILATPALAHHSFAMFEPTKMLTLQGTVKELQWTNPHCYLQVLVPAQSDAKDAEWSIEMHSPLAMYRDGWRPRSFVPGDKVTIVIHPLKNGANGGRGVYAIDPGGRTLWVDKASVSGKPLP